MTEKFTLHQQILEVENELAIRKEVYAKRVAAGKMRQSESDFRMDRMRAVLATLKTLERYAEPVKAAIAAAKAKERAA
jgi:hypothetical protein